MSAGLDAAHALKNLARVLLRDTGKAMTEAGDAFLLETDREIRRRKHAAWIRAIYNRIDATNAYNDACDLVLMLSDPDWAETPTSAATPPGGSELDDPRRLGNHGATSSAAASVHPPASLAAATTS